MATSHHYIFKFRLLPWLCLLMSLVGGTVTLSFAAEEPDPRAKLERLLACQQLEKDAALTEKRKIETHLQEVQAFRAELTDAPKHRLAIEKAQEALAKDRGALAKVEERLRLVELRIGLTLRAMKYLPMASRDESLSLDEQAKVQFAKWWADRKLVSDSEFDKQWQAKYGFVDAPELQARLTGIIERLHAVSADADAPVTVRIVNRPNEAGASATRSFVYFDKAYLDRNPSDDELLFVAGHELAHVQLHHVSLGAVQAHWQGFEQDWLRKSVEGSHPAYQRPGEHHDASWRTRMAQYIREQEAQADLLGAQQALAAGASPRGIKDAFTRMFFDDLKRRLGSDTSGLDPHYEKNLEDHDRPDVRLKALEDVLGEKFWGKPTLRFASSCHRSMGH